MIDYLKENYIWLSVTIVPIIVAIIGAIAVVIKKSDRNQKIKEVNGNGNVTINGDISNNVK